MFEFSLCCIATSRLVCPLLACCDVFDPQYDAVIIVTDKIDKLTQFSDLGKLQTSLSQYSKVTTMYMMHMYSNTEFNHL